MPSTPTLETTAVNLIMVCSHVAADNGPISYTKAVWHTQYTPTRLHTYTNTYLLCRQLQTPQGQARIRKHRRQVISLKNEEINTATEQLHVQQDGDEDAPHTAKCRLADVWERLQGSAGGHAGSQQVRCVAGYGAYARCGMMRMGYIHHTHEEAHKEASVRFT